MKKWKIIRVIAILFLLIFLLYLLSDAVICMNMVYPHPMLGIDASNWIEQFFVDLVFIIIIWWIPLIVDTVLIIISIVKLRKVKAIRKF